MLSAPKVAAGPPSTTLGFFPRRPRGEVGGQRPRLMLKFERNSLQPLQQ